MKTTAAGRRLCFGWKLAINTTSAGFTVSPLKLPVLLPQAEVNCQKVQSMPEVTFSLHGRDFTIPASAYVLQVSLIPV